MRTALLVAVLLSATAKAAEPRELLMFAAASTSNAVTEVVGAFEAKNPGVKVRTSFAGTNELLRQLQAGAKADLFLSADEASITRVKSHRQTVPLFSNALVVVVHSASTRTALVPDELPAMKRIAIADPLSVPAGKYAKAWLVAVGLWTELESKLIPSLDVRAALAAAEAGRVDAAIVYATDAASSKKVREVYRVPKEAAAVPIAYGLAQLGGSKDAALLYDFVKGADAAAVFARHGFVTK